MHSLTTVQFSAHHAEHSLVQYRLSRTQYRLSRTQYRLSRTQYPLSRMQYPLSRHLFLLMILMIIPLNLILRIFQITRFLLCFVTLWILSASLLRIIDFVKNVFTGCYLMDFIGIIVALLATHSSKYTMFHVRQALKITVVSILSVFVLIIPFLGWIAFPILQGIIWVIKIISFFQICSGKAKEPAIIRSFGFLR